MVGRHRLLVIALVVTAGYTGYLQVQVNYARNQAVETARELAAPVRELCRDDAASARRLGEATCERASEVATDPRDADAEAATLGPVGRGATARLRSGR